MAAGTKDFDVLAQTTRRSDMGRYNEGITEQASDKRHVGFAVRPLKGVQSRHTHTLEIGCCLEVYMRDEFARKTPAEHT